MMTPSASGALTHSFLGSFGGLLLSSTPTTEDGWVERATIFALIPELTSFGDLDFLALATCVQAMLRSTPMAAIRPFGKTYRLDLDKLVAALDRLNTSLKGQLDLSSKKEAASPSRSANLDMKLPANQQLKYRGGTKYGIPKVLEYTDPASLTRWVWTLSRPWYPGAKPRDAEGGEEQGGKKKGKGSKKSPQAAEAEEIMRAMQRQQGSKAAGSSSGAKARKKQKTDPAPKKAPKGPVLTGDAQSLHSGSDLISPNPREWFNDAQLATAAHLEADPMRAARMVKTNYPRPSRMVPQLFGEPTAQKALASKSLTIVQQYCDGMHWHNLAIIGPTAQIVMWEPFGSRLGDRDAIMIAAKKAAAKASSSDKWGRTWKVKVLTLKLQDDGYQCGVWSHYFRGLIYGRLRRHLLRQRAARAADARRRLGQPVGRKRRREGAEVGRQSRLRRCAARQDAQDAAGGRRRRQSAVPGRLAGPDVHGDREERRRLYVARRAPRLEERD